MLANVLVLGVVVVLVVVRNMRPQRMNVERLWLAPVVLTAATGFSVFGSLAANASLLLVGALCAAGAVAGIPFGLLRGRHSAVRPTGNPKILLVEPSPIVMIVWLAAYGLKFGIRALAPNAGGSALAASDGFLAFAVSSVIAARYVIFTKFKALHAA